MQFPKPCDLLPPGTHRMSFAEPWSILEPVNNGTVSCRPYKARTPSRSGLSADCCTGTDIVTDSIERTCQVSPILPLSAAERRFSCMVVTGMHMDAAMAVLRNLGSTIGSPSSNKTKFAMLGSVQN